MLQNISSVYSSLETRSEMFPAFEKTLSLKNLLNSPSKATHTHTKTPLKLYIWIKICSYMCR